MVDDKKIGVLFVCLGNICRSPAAEEILKVMCAGCGMADRVEIDSAGTYGGHAGELPDGRMRKAAAGRGYSLTSRSRPLCSDDFDRFDMILAMDDAVYETCFRRAPSIEAGNRIYRMVEFCSRIKTDHVPDPYYGGASGFDNVLDILEDACHGLLEHLKRELQ